MEWMYKAILAPSHLSAAATEDLSGDSPFYTDAELHLTLAAIVEFYYIHLPRGGGNARF